ncbi:MAG: hypothetical protein GX483_01060 [Actinomycetaceae bacterium]|nr:hypothetical protein [Actinomycetaceae bacterium]
MRKILFIGAGGSGAATLQYTMDQIAADLKARGAGDQIPLSWQFLVVDAPLNEEGFGQGGFRTVREYNEGAREVGAYCSIGTVQNFETVAANILNKLTRYAQLNPESRDVASDFASWLPNNSSDMNNINTIPLSDGAGQFRTVGRVLFLNRLTEVVGAIRQAHARMQTTQAQADADRIESIIPGLYSDDTADDADNVRVFIVGSLAGGSGASMLIDLARAVKAAIPAKADVYLYGYAPEIFQNVSGGVTPDHMGNALATAAEIQALIANPESKANRRDAELFEALGHASKEKDATFAIFSPIGLSQGTAGAQGHRNADPRTIYRRFGRGIGRLVLNTSAFDNFVRYSLGNPLAGATQVDSRFFDWGSAEGSSLWSSFGYASLSMGRDRFREYAAQRLARYSVDILTEGHIDPKSTETGAMQLRQRIDNNIHHFLDQIGIPALTTRSTNLHADAQAWSDQKFLALYKKLADDYASRFMAFIPPLNPGDNNVESVDMWVQQVRGAALSAENHFAPLQREMIDQARMGLRFELDSLTERITHHTEEAMARVGVEYARGLLSETKANYVHLLSATLQESHVNAPKIGEHLTGQLTDIERHFLGNKKAKIIDGLGQNVSKAFRNAVHSYIGNVVRNEGFALLSRALADMVDNFFKPLEDALNNQLGKLNVEKGRAQEAVGVEMYSTDTYAHWPYPGNDDIWPGDPEAPYGEVVPQRFRTAHNEVVITEPESFPQEYENRLLEDQPNSASRVDAQKKIAEAVISGRWNTIGGVESPKDLIVLRQRWRADNLRDQQRGEEALPAQFAIKATSADVMRRALAYVDRRGEAFERYNSQGFIDYLMDEMANDVERNQRQDNIAQKFLQVVQDAQPMVGVSQTVAQSIHPEVQRVERQLTYSTIPFADQRSGQRIFDSLSRQTGLRPESVQRFQKQMEEPDNDRTVQRVDVFGSYTKYSPIVFASLFQPIYQKWVQTRDVNQSLVKFRRSRPLAGFVPISNRERMALIEGWILGRIFGLIKVPQTGRSAVEIRELGADDTWHRFPWPLYTRVNDFVEEYRADEWLPAVLESLPLAWLEWYRNDVVINDERESPTRTYYLMRAFSDDETAPLNYREGRKAVELLAEYLRTGQAVAGVEPLLQAKGDSQEERLAELREYFEEYIADYSQVFLDPHGQFAKISRIEHVYAVPLTVDIADEVVQACQNLLELTEVANNLSERGARDNASSGRRRPGIR